MIGLKDVQENEEGVVTQPKGFLSFLGPDPTGKKKLIFYTVGGVIVIAGMVLVYKKVLKKKAPSPIGIGVPQ